MVRGGGDGTERASGASDALTLTNAQRSATPMRPLSKRVRLTLVIGSLALLLYALVNWLLLLWRGLHSIAGRYDFSTYYAAAAALRADLHANIYDEQVLARIGADAHVLVNPPLPYTYPPLFAILLSPFTFLSFRVLSRVWLLANAALWLGLALLFANEIRILLGTTLASVTPTDGATTHGKGASLRAWLAQLLRDDPAPLVALAASALLCLSFAPAAQTLALGQIDFIVLAPLALVPWLTRHGHERWVGVAIALAAMLKLTPALLIGYLLLRRRWQAALSALVALVALTIVSGALVGPDHMLASLPQALRVGTGDATLGQNEALFAPLLTLFALNVPSLLDAAQVISRILLASLALWLAWFLWRAPRSSVNASDGQDIREWIGYGIALCAMVLLAPTAWIHHYVWVLPALVLALGLAGAYLVKGLRTTGAATRDLGAATWMLVIAILSALALGWNLPHGWDTEQHPAVTHLFGLPLWPLLLELRPLGTLGVVLVLSQWYAGRERMKISAGERDDGRKR
ncbi:MAG TPA: glycosyltransferase family 87 protein [Ktedonobacterales bacterium]